MCKVSQQQRKWFRVQWNRNKKKRRDRDKWREIDYQIDRIKREDTSIHKQ